MLENASSVGIMPPSWIQANSPRGEGAKPRASARGSRVAERSDVNLARPYFPKASYGRVGEMVSGCPCMPPSMRRCTRYVGEL